MVNNPSRAGAEQLESRWDRAIFTGNGNLGMGDRGPKACGPCVALASKECQADPNRTSVYTLVPVRISPGSTRSRQLHQSAGPSCCHAEGSSARRAQASWEASRLAEAGP